MKLPNDFSAQNRCASRYSWFFRQKLACGLLRESLYSNETLEHWPRGSFAALSAKEGNAMSTKTNTATHSKHRFRHRKKTQTQQTKQSVTGVFCSNLDLNTVREKPSQSVFVEIVWRTWCSYVGLDSFSYFHHDIVFSRSGGMCLEVPWWPSQ